MLSRFYLDDDSADRRVIFALRARGIDVQAPWDSNLYGAPDEQHLAHAARERRVLVTSNVKDFLQIHFRVLSEGAHHAGIVFVVQQKYSLSVRIDRLHRLALALDPAEIADRYEFLRDWGA